MQISTFALPTLGTDVMSTSDQADLLLNQATAAIVCGYLEHINALVGAVPPITAGPPPGGLFTNNSQAFSPEELVQLINEVQVALRNV
jgi:hypothetical protein